MPDLLEGYVEGGHLVDAAGLPLADVLDHRISRGYGVMRRRYVRVRTDVGVFSGSCLADENFLRLRRVKGGG